MQELLDVVNEDDHVIGQIARKELSRDSNAIVRLVGVQVFRQGKALFQLRQSSKQLYPSHWTLSATGHVSAGEGYDDAAKRELVEEVGIHDPITRIDKRLLSYDGVRRMWAFFHCDSEAEPVIQHSEVERAEYVALNTDGPGPLPSTMDKITPSLRFYLQVLMAIRNPK